MKNIWKEIDNEFHLVEASKHIDELPFGIYKTELDLRTNKIFLVKTSENFEMPNKIYGFEEKFIERALKTYHETKGNLGILLNGVKGTGKTVTAKGFANRLGLPVIIVTEKYDHLSSFINDIQQNVVVFFDEYEKMYNNYDSSILTVMEGVLDNQYRKVFLLTTNDGYINENMKQRPGRIRYFKTFKDLDLESIKEIIDDLLIHKEFAEETEKFISELEIVTVDIVRAIIEEINIHKESPVEFKDIFNIQKVDNVYNVIKISKEGDKITEEVEYLKAKVTPAKFSEKAIGLSLQVNGDHIGKIKSVIADTVRVESYDEYEAGGGPKVFEYRLEKVFYIHKSF